MKSSVFIYFLFLIIVGCGEDEMERLDLSTGNVFNLESGEKVIRIKVRSESQWSVWNPEPWCQTKQVGDSLILYVEMNLLEKERSATLRVSNMGNNIIDINVNQAAAPEEYHYQLPIIVHVLYEREDDKQQNIPAMTISAAVDKANAFFRNSNRKGVDLNLELVMATHNPQGNPLPEEGINRIQRPNIEFDATSFLKNQHGDASWLWDQNKYINIVIFKFTDPNELGVAHLPFTPWSMPLEGLNRADRYYTQLPTDHARGMAWNNTWFGRYLATPEGAQELWVTTLIHELGHYLGMLHPFSSGVSEESDYCADTPDYDRSAYQKWIYDLRNPDWDVVTKRMDRRETEFTSTNIMDYDFGKMDRFTLNQRQRVRHVLTYSPLIPGPKISLKRDLSRAELDEPYVIIK